MEKVEIVYNYDPDCEMEQLLVNGVEVGLGNAWDDHLDDGAQTLTAALKVIGVPFNFTRGSDWAYED